MIVRAELLWDNLNVRENFLHEHYCGDEVCKSAVFKRNRVIGTQVV